MAQISWDDFLKLDIRVGTIIKAEAFPKANKPAYKISVDFGKDIGIKKTSAQITDLYHLDHLIGKQVLGVVNLPSKQIGPFMSEFLLTGLVQANGKVVLVTSDQKVENGLRLL
jgi:tRNA-binding protein